MSRRPVRPASPFPPPSRELRVTVAEPCSEDWDAMGEGAVRRCEKCRTDVHDLGALGPEVARDLVERGGCARFQRRPDGTVHFPRVAVLALAMAACAPHPVAVGEGVAGGTTTAPIDGAGAREAATALRCVPPSPAALVEVPAGELHLLVIDDTGLPIPGVLVNLAASGQPVRQVVTDAEGAAVLAALAPGEWRWEALHAGFSRQEGRVTLPDRSGVALTVELVSGNWPIVLGLVVVRSPPVDTTTVPAGITLPSGTLDRLPR